MAAAGEGGSGHELRLLGSWASPFVLRPRIALNLKGLHYEFLQHTRGEPKSDLLLASNPVYKKIPVLLHNGKPICESAIIVQYLDDAFPAAGVTIMPSHPHHRALHRFWAYYVDDKLVPAFSQIGKAKTEEARKEAVEQTLAGMDLLEGAFVELSGGKPYFGGDGIGLVDIVFGGYIGWLRAAAVLVGVDLLDKARFPSLAAWAERFCGHDAVKGIMPETAKLVEYYHKYVAADDAAAAASS